VLDGSSNDGAYDDVDDTLRQRGEAGEIIDLDFNVTPDIVSRVPYVEDGVVVTAIPATHHGGGNPFDPIFFLFGSVLYVSGEDRGAAEFSLGGQPFDLLHADFDSPAGRFAFLDGFVGDTLRISAMFPGTWEPETPGDLPGVGGTPLHTFQFTDPAWRGLTSFVFDTTGEFFGSAIDNVRLHVSLPPNWILGAVGSLMAMAFLRRRGSPSGCGGSASTLPKSENRG
jgi:hypothetical protein